jgi:hypothetical protein
MVNFARIEAPLDAGVRTGASVGSVLWLIADDRDNADLSAYLETLLLQVELRTVWEVRCRRVATRPPLTLATYPDLDVAASVRVDFAGSEIRIGDRSFQSASFIGEIGKLDLTRPDPFRALTGRPQMATAETIFPSWHRGIGGWSSSAIQYALASCAWPLVLLESSKRVRESLLVAYIAETIIEGGIAVIPIAPEMIGRGVALTGSADSIDDLSAAMRDAKPIDPSEIKASRELATMWPWM